ncbi:DNA adenine methylase, partial [Spirochaetota bacterium]
MKIKYDPEYVENFLIAYIGNKRRLIGLIKRAMEALPIKNSRKKRLSFIDYFAGSGVVSKLAKSAGFDVISNDWEYYSYIINKAFLEISNEDLDSLFKKEGGIGRVIDTINDLCNVSKKEEYIAKYYCPHSDKNPDIEHERMFYTKENGRIIDRIRKYIDTAYPESGSACVQKKRILLIALLLYYSSKHSNTSGVFKGFHKGFGGSGGDALTRILGRIELTIPKLSAGKGRYKIFKADALALAKRLKKIKTDIAYLDPPYNQ